MSSNDTTSATLWHQKVFNGVVFAETLAVIVSECLTLPLFLIHADYRASSSHQIMLCIGLFDLVQIVPDFVIRLCSYVGVTQFPLSLAKFISAMSLVFWDILIFQHFVLAFNRCFIIVRSYFKPTIGESKLQKMLFRALNGTVWLCALAVFVLFQTPLIGGTITKGSIVFDDTLPYTWVYETVEMPLSLGCLGCSFCAYLILVFVLKKKNVTAPNHIQAQNASTERRILFQAVVLFVGILAIELVWYFVDSADWVAHEPFMIVFVAYCALNNVLYLVTIKEFRKRFIRLYGLQKLFSSAAFLPGHHTVHVQQPSVHNRVVSIQASTSHNSRSRVP